MKRIVFLLALYTANSFSQNYLSTPLEYPKSESSINIGLLQKVLDEKQKRYDDRNKPSCDFLMSFLVSVSSKHERAPIPINSSSLLISADYYSFDQTSAVIAYFRRNEYDSIGIPYIFCQVSQQTWDNFIYNGKLYSWGKSFHFYIMEKKCDCK